MNETNSEQKVEIGALWKKTGKSQKFLSGTINLKALGYDKDVPVVVFTNKYKQKDTHPDLRIYLSKPKSEAQPQKVNNPITVKETVKEEQVLAPADDDVM
jgi:uncharacterized protein (DUF736 family)